MHTLILLALLPWFSANLYSFTVSSSEGVAMPLSQFQGKKILLVNTASQSPLTKQYASLEALALRYPEQLVIIAFPSNSFGHEPLDNAGVRSLVQTSYGTHFLLAQKSVVAGTEQAPLFGWLTTSSLNGVMHNPVKEDFQKFLINEKGELVSYFASVVDPMSPDIQAAIQE